MSDPVDISDDEITIFFDAVFTREIRELDEFHPKFGTREFYKDYDFDAQPEMVNRDRTMWLPDGFKTRDHLKRLYKDTLTTLRMEYAKEMIVDSNMPVHLYLDWIDNGDGTIEPIDSGRLAMLHDIIRLEYREAFPQLREIVLHDDSAEMKWETVEGLGKLGGKESAMILRDILEYNEGPISNYLKHDAVKELRHLPYPECARPIIKIFEENLAYPDDTLLDYETSLEEQMGVHMGMTTENYCLIALSSIPTLEALEGIKIGIYHNDKAIHRQAVSAMHTWIYSATKHIMHDESEIEGDIVSTIRKLSSIFGLDDPKKVYMPSFRYVP